MTGLETCPVEIINKPDLEQISLGKEIDVIIGCEFSGVVRQAFREILSNSRHRSQIVFRVKRGLIFGGL